MDIKIPENTTVLDVVLNETGSIAGLPVLLKQLPVGSRVGFSTLPKVYEEVLDIGQTWTPKLDGLVLNVELPVYNTLAVEKHPFSTNLFELEDVVVEGNTALRNIVEPIPPPPIHVLAKPFVDERPEYPDYKYLYLSLSVSEKISCELTIGWGVYYQSNWYSGVLVLPAGETETMLLFADLSGGKTYIVDWFNPQPYETCNQKRLSWSLSG